MEKQKDRTVEDILTDGIPKELVSLFQFSLAEQTNEEIVMRFCFWSRYFFPQYFLVKDTKEPIRDALIHAEIDLDNVLVYRGSILSFTDIVFRGGAKTTRTKLFIAFVILNDRDNYRRYFKILTKDTTNSKQIVTDIYNMFVGPRITAVYPHTFEKSDYKREETMHTFTTSKGVKVSADTVGVDQRGALQEDARPDFIWFDDFETRKTLRSAPETKAIGDNMEEARTGLSVTGGCIYTCNYISERGKVHQLVMKENTMNKVLIVPIIKNGIPTWPEMYPLSKIEQIRMDAEDFEGEYLCEPSAGADVLFDRENLKNMRISSPIKTYGQFKMFERYNPSHRYAIGADVAMGVGLDSSTSVVIDFDTMPCKVIATFKDNTIKPDVFGYELIAQGDRLGECLIAPENNPGGGGGTTINILKQQNYLNIFTIQPKDTDVIEREANRVYGWNTNVASKPKMMMALRKAVDDGFLELQDKDLIQEAKSYSRDDLMDKEVDARLTTRHFDLLIACAIAWQMKDYAIYSDYQTDEQKEEAYNEEYNMSWEEKFGII